MKDINKCKILHQKLISRFQSETSSFVPSDTVSRWLFQTICNIYEVSGEEEAERYVREAKLY